MNIKNREHLKKRIEIDLELLISESWSIEVVKDLKKVLNDLKEIYLEGYDD